MAPKSRRRSEIHEHLAGHHRQRERGLRQHCDRVKARDPCRSQAIGYQVGDRGQCATYRRENTTEPADLYLGRCAHSSSRRSPELGRLHAVARVSLIPIAVWGLSTLPVGGLAQWLFLRQKVPALKTKLGLWMLVTAPLGTLVLAAVVVPGLGWFFILLTFGLPDGIGLSVLQGTMALAIVLGLGAACGGILAAVLQALFLRRTVSRAGWWIPPTVLGWILGAVGGVFLSIQLLSILTT